MLVVHHAHLAGRPGPTGHGLVAAGLEQGIAGFEVRVLLLAPGASMDEGWHDGELVGIALRGGGKLLIDGGPQRFQAPCSLLIPRRAIYRVANNGASPLQIVWVAAAVRDGPSVSPASG